MDNNLRYVVLSLELHLFFARIMKEHSLFLEAAFTPVDSSFAKQAELYKQEFEKLLYWAAYLGNGVVSEKVLSSGEIVTQFTEGAERQTQQFTGISINGEVTELELQMNSWNGGRVNSETYRQVRQMNQIAIELLDGLIRLKETILSNVLSCQMFTMNYPLLIEHILREANLYRTCVRNFENGKDFDCQNMRQTQTFWNQIMMEHALFIRGLLDPTENELINTSDSFAKDYAVLLAKSKEMNDRTMMHHESLEETLKFRDFKMAGTQGIQECKIRSIILPLLADHVLREANHYIRLLND